jgi:predicted benzoate:H+ symporter BenE
MGKVFAKTSTKMCGMWRLWLKPIGLSAIGMATIFSHCSEPIDNKNDEKRKYGYHLDVFDLRLDL